MAREPIQRPAAGNQRHSNKGRYDTQQLRADREPCPQPGHNQRSMWSSPLPIDPSLDLCYATNGPLSPRSDLLPSNFDRQDRAAQARIPGPSDTFSRDLQIPSLASSDANPLVRFYNDPGPWNSQRIEGFAPAPMGSRNLVWNERVSKSNVPFQQYRDSARSEVESSFTGRHPSDSGYGTRSYTTKSVLSADPVDQSQESRSLASQLDYMQMCPEPSSQEYIASDPRILHMPAFGTQDDVPGPQSAALGLLSLRCAWDGCTTTSKNQSEHRKHLLRHEKPFRCEVADCTRIAGFSTRNDLDRHKKSKHKITPTNGTDRSFRCVASKCPKKEKVWPRLDNFRQHCKRMHAEEDMETLVQLSELGLGYQPASYASEGGFAHASRPSEDDSKRSEPESLYFTNLQALQKVPGNLPQQDNTCPEPTDIDRLGSKASDESTGAETPMDASVLTAHGGSKLQNSQTPWPIDNRLDPGFPRVSSCPSGPKSVEVYPMQSLDHEENVAPGALKAVFSSQRLVTDCRKNTTTKTAEAILVTKAEQLSKAIESNVEKCMKKAGSLEDIQKVIKSTVLNLFNGSRKRGLGEEAPSAACAYRSKPVACDQCDKTVQRPCDLNKHKKRHSRPYGCTYTTCSKAFGSKNDWKRHENSQHYQLEAWRCHEHDSLSRIKECARLFYRREPFQAHLKEQHGIKDEEHIKAQSKRGRIGRNCQSGFWCGFCQKIVQLKSKGLDAWDERFNHIDDMHFKKGQSIGEWYPLDKDIPKSLLRSDNVLDNGTPAQRDPDEGDTSSDEDDEGDRTDVGNRTSYATTAADSPLDTSMNGTANVPCRLMPQLPAAGKHILDNEEGAEDVRRCKRQRRSRIKFCCQCDYGPYNIDTYVGCMLGCQHQFCANCPVERREGELEE